MQRFRAGALMVVLACLRAPCPARGDEPPPAAPGSNATPASEAAADRHPDLVRLSPREEVWIDRARTEVVVGGAIALDRGAIEVFACPARTKDHEAVVATQASAKLVHMALLAIGLDPGRPVRLHPEYRPAEGPVVAIRMRWKDADGAAHECPAQDWIRNVQTGAALDADWVFTGSEFWRDPADGREYYQADGGDFVCVSNFSAATLDLPIESSHSNEALLFEVFEGRVPPRGTPVEMVLSARR